MTDNMQMANPAPMKCKVSFLIVKGTVEQVLSAKAGCATRFIGYPLFLEDTCSVGDPRPPATPTTPAAEAITKTEAVDNASFVLVPLTVEVKYSRRLPFPKMGRSPPEGY